MTNPQASAGSGTRLHSKIGKGRSRSEASQDPVSFHTGHIVEIATERKFRQAPPPEDRRGVRATVTKQIIATYHLSGDLMSRLLRAGEVEDGSCVINGFLRKRLSNPEESLDQHFLTAGPKFKHLVRIF